MKWDRKEFKLIGQNGEIHDLGPHEFWYLAPAETNFQLHNATVPPLDYAILLHNARLGEGVVPPMRKLLEGLPRTTNKRGVAAQAEQLLEDIRNIHFPDLPSRLRCHFLNFDRVVAECRSNSMFRRKRILTPCYTILTDSSFHFADVAPVATSNSPICGRVKFPQGERQEWTDCYSEWLAFARRLAASLRR